ncbi:MAG: ABC transporter ATP-binding protein [Desulfobacterales bacterium]|nr:ABC transporter ATP-binding protein [Desulfobacterales bacterium]
MDDGMLKLIGVSKAYEAGGMPVEVLRDVNLSMKSGEKISVTGASGIGKSTLLHIIGTLDRPDEGRLIWNSQDVFSSNDEELAHFRNRTIGFVFQFHHLLPEFSALENTMLPLLIGGDRGYEVQESAEAILDRVGLSHRLHHRAGALSGGEQQRVAIARAVVGRPQILLADEPTGNLDGKNSSQVHELLNELNQELGMTLVVVTHNMELAGLMDRQITLEGGQVVERI